MQYADPRHYADPEKVAPGSANGTLSTLRQSPALIRPSRRLASPSKEYDENNGVAIINAFFKGSELHAEFSASTHEEERI
jgi:hypothetical protein